MLFQKNKQLQLQTFLGHWLLTFLQRMIDVKYARIWVQRNWQLALAIFSTSLLLLTWLYLFIRKLRLSLTVRIPKESTLQNVQTMLEQIKNQFPSVSIIDVHFTIENESDTQKQESKKTNQRTFRMNQFLQIDKFKQVDRRLEDIERALIQLPVEVFSLFQQKSKSKLKTPKGISELDTLLKQARSNLITEFRLENLKEDLDVLRVQFICGVLETSTSVTKIVIQKKLDDPMFDKLASFLCKNKVIKEVDLSNNPQITSASVDALANIINSNSTITT